MSEENKTIAMNQKALIVCAPGVGYIIKLEDGSKFALSSGLALDIADQIIATESGSAPAYPTPPAKNGYIL